MIQIKINKKDSKPLYVQIRDTIEQAIEKNKLKPGDKLPPVAALAKTIGVTHATVRRALGDLSEKGYTKCHVGRGTFVENPAEPDAGESSPTGTNQHQGHAGYGFRPAGPELQCAARRMRRGVSEGLMELMRLAQQPGLIDFSKGIPDPGLLPENFLKELSDLALSQDPMQYMACSDFQGMAPLRRAIAQRYMEHGMDVTPDQILITNGSQQAASLVALEAAEKKRPVVCEAPCFQGIPETFVAHGNWVDTVVRDDQGPVMEHLGHFNGYPYMLYLSEQLHNPTGFDLTEDRMNAVIQWARRNSATLLVDGVFSDLRYGRRPKYNIFNALGDTQTIMISSFSKSVMSGFRVGWMVSSKARIRAFTKLKRLTDQISPPLMQGLVTQMLVSGRYDTHLNRIKQVYQERRQVLLEGLTQLMPDSISWTTPAGGFSIWLTLPEGYSSVALLLSAVDKGITFLPGPLFDLDQRYVRSFRLSWAWVEKDQIAEGVEILADTIKELLRHSPGDLGLSGLGNFQ